MVIPEEGKPPLLSDSANNLSCEMCVGRPVLQVKIHITGDTALTATFTCSQCRGRSNHEPLQGNALALHEVAKEKKNVKTGVGSENVIRTTTVMMSLQGQIYNLQITSFNGKPINTPSARFQKDSSIESVKGKPCLSTP